MDYHIGQVFYVVFTKQTAVLPFRIVEKTTKQTLRGDETIYKAECPKFEKQVFTLSEIESKGKVFLTIDDVRTFMLERATAAVMQIVEAANTMSNKWYGENQQQSHDDGLHEFVASEQHVQKESADSDYETVVLADGRAVKMRKVPRQG